MPYLGAVKPTETTSSVLRSTYTGDGSTTTFNLPGPVANEISIIATINGVTQQDSAYTTNGSQIIFASAPANGDAIELRTISDVGLSYAPFAGSVTTGILADDAVTAAKLASGAAASNLGSGDVTAAMLASTLDLTGKTVTLPAGTGGKVLQVVNAVYSTYVITSSLSYVDTGFSATITPSSASSKVLAFVNIPDAHNNVTTSILYLMLVRGSTQLIEFVKHGDYIATSDPLVTYGGSTSYLDSPNTTSATTYKIQFKVQTGSQSLFLNNGTGTITLMEIAA